MTLIVEDGTGKTDAETYVSEADADTYHAKMGNTSWAALASADKEVYLRQAAQYLDAKYLKRWKGVRANETQALDWPQSGVYDQSGYALDDDVIPQQLKDACAEAAFRASTTTLMADIDTPGSITRERSKIGPIEEEFEYSGGRSQTPYFTLVHSLLKDLLQASNEVQRG